MLKNIAFAHLLSSSKFFPVCTLFDQLVGLCDEELRLVQRWTGSHVAELMRRLPDTGGNLLVTDMRRKLSLFELEPQLFDYVNEHLRREGSNLSGVTTQYFAWAPISPSAMSELLPGETEARRLYQSVKRSDYLVIGRRNVNHSNQYSQRTDDPCVPTDLSMPRASESRSKSQHSPGPIAMDTDEVAAAIRKPTDEDEFVDVVGDSGPPSMLDTKMSFVDNKDAKHMSDVIPSITTEPAASTETGSLGTPDCGPVKTNDSQSISAPGGFSPWCGRLEVSGGRCFTQSGAVCKLNFISARAELKHA